MRWLHDQMAAVWAKAARESGSTDFPASITIRGPWWHDALSAFQLAESAALVVVILVEYHYGWNPVALTFTAFAGFAGIIGDGTRRYLSKRGATDKTKSIVTVAALLLCLSFALLAVLADHWTRPNANKIPIFVTGGRIISRPANGMYLLAAKLTVQNDSNTDLQVRWSAAEAFGNTSTDEVNRANDIASVRRMGDTVSERIGTGTLPRKIATDISTPELALSRAAYERFMSGNGTFYFSGTIEAVDGSWKFPICGYSLGDPNTVIQCPK